MNNRRHIASAFCFITIILAQFSAAKDLTVDGYVKSEEIKVKVSADLCMKDNTPVLSDLCQQWRMANAADKQISLIEEQNILTKASFISSIFAAVLSFIALSFAVYSERRSSRLQALDSRAYLKTNLFQLKLNLAGDRRFGATAEIKNVGKTIASAVTSRTYVDILEIDPDSDITFQFPEFNKHGTRSLIPGDLFWSNGKSDKLLTDEMIEKIDKKQAYVCIWGKVVYMDIFGKQHETAFSAYANFTNSIRAFSDPKHSENGEYLFFKVGNYSN